MFLENHDGYKKQGSLYSLFQYDDDFMDVKTAKELIELLDSKEEHYMYFTPRKFITKVIVKEWEYMENILAVHIFPIVAWQKKNDNNYYVAVTVDRDFESGFVDCLGEQYKKGLALAWKYTPSQLHELLWLSHLGRHAERDWKTKEGITISLIISMNWIAFYNSLDRNLNNYRYYEEVKRSIALNLDEKVVIESINKQRREYFKEILQKNREYNTPAKLLRFQE